MLISIIIPIFNVEKEIERCLLSVIEQEYPCLEIILVDDASPDLSYNKAQRLIDHYPDCNIISLRHTENLGLSVARNTGLNHATGDYVLFLDSDDALVSSDVISNFVMFIKSYNFPDILIGNYTIVGRDNSCRITQLHLSDNESIYNAYLSSVVDVIACGKFYLRSFLERNRLRFEPGIYHEDNLWTFHWVQYAENVLIVPDVIFEYYLRDGSITSSFTTKHVRDQITILLKIYDEWKQMPVSRRDKLELLLGLLLRKNLQQIYRVQNDQDFILSQLERLKTIKLPLFLKGKFSFFKQNILLKLPTRWLNFWLKHKFKPRNKPSN